MAFPEQTAMASQALSSLAHEINNALQSIDGGNDLLQDAIRQGNLAELEQVWRMVRHKQLKLADMIQDLLFLSQTEIPDSPLVPLKEIVERAIRATAWQAEFCQVAVRCTVANSGCEDLAYPEILQQCLYKILDLRIQACADTPGGWVAVEAITGTDGHAVELRIVDNGEPMSELDLLAFRDPLAVGEQLNRFGVAMSVAQIIARALGGRVDINNRGDQGCLTTVTLVGRGL